MTDIEQLLKRREELEAEIEALEDCWSPTIYQHAQLEQLKAERDNVIAQIELAEIYPDVR